MALLVVAVIYLWHPFKLGDRIAQLGLVVDFLETLVATVMGATHPHVLKQAVISSR
jgi:hypothetical protein